MTKDLVTLSDDNFDTEISRSENGPILVDFWATWCGPCRVVAPILEDLASELKGKARIGKLDVDQNPGTASQYGVRSIPTLMLFKDGKQVDALVGAQSKEKISALINRHS